MAAGKEVEDAKKELAAAQSRLEQTTAALDTVQRQVGRAEVQSPITGQIVKRMVSGGEQVDGSAAQPILEVANLDRVELEANVPSGSLSRVQVGQLAAVASDAYPGKTFAGSVVAIAPAVDPRTNAALVRIRIRNAEHLLKVGMFAETRLRLSSPSSPQPGACLYQLATSKIRNCSLSFASVIRFERSIWNLAASYRSSVPTVGRNNRPR